MFWMMYHNWPVQTLIARDFSLTAEVSLKHGMSLSLNVEVSLIRVMYPDQLM